jgi:hypothetical protein
VAGLDTLNEAIHFDGMIESQACRETRADPQCVGRFDEHAIRADVARAGAQYGGAPFDLDCRTEA